MRLSFKFNLLNILCCRTADNYYSHHHKFVFKVRYHWIKMVFSKEDKILIKFTRTEGLRFYPFSYRIEAPSARVEQVTFLSFREKRV